MGNILKYNPIVPKIQIIFKKSAKYVQLYKYKNIKTANTL